MKKVNEVVYFPAEKIYFTLRRATGERKLSYVLMVYHNVLNSQNLLIIK